MPSLAALELLTVKDVVRLSALSPSTVRRAIDLRQLGHVRVGRAVRITTEQYNDWIRRISVPVVL